MSRGEQARDVAKPKNQHIIPKFYQMAWEAQDKGNRKCLYRLDISTLTIKRVSISSNCSAEYHFEPDKENPSGAIEKLHSSDVESKVAPDLKSFIKGERSHLIASKKDKKMLCDLLCYLSGRDCKNLYGDENTRKSVSLFTLGYPDREFELHALMCVYSVAFNGRGKAYYNYWMRVLQAKEPVFVFCDRAAIQVWEDKRRDEIYFPISPTLCIKLSKKPAAVDGQFILATNEDVDTVDSMCMRGEDVKYIFANNQETLERIRNKLTAER